MATYDVFWRSGTGVAGNYKNLVNYEEALHTMSLVAKDEYLSLWRQLEKDSIWAQKSTPKAAKGAGVLHYKIDVKMGAKKHNFTFSGLDHGRTHKYALLVKHIRSFVIKYAGEIPFRNVFFDPGILGWVNITSAPSARVLVGGRDIGLTTPVYGYELPRGKHEITLILPSGTTRKHTLMVEPGMTTIVHIDMQ